MPKIAVHFQRLFVKSPEAGSTDEHMVSRVIFGLDVDGKHEGMFWSDLKQTVGAPMAADAIEVEPPRRIFEDPASAQKAALEVFPGDDDDRFAKEARQYFRGLVGPTGTAYNFTSTSEVTSKDCVVVAPKTITFEV